jgi:hypothetical protein
MGAGIVFVAGSGAVLATGVMDGRVLSGSDLGSLSKVSNTVRSHPRWSVAEN